MDSAFSLLEYPHFRFETRISNQLKPLQLVALTLCGTY
jgi:hypothetical protein